METKVILCDSCKGKVAKWKCCFCEKDVCEDCRIKIRTTFLLENSNILLFADMVCYKCNDSLTELNKIEDDMNRSGVILNVLKDFLALKELKKGEKA